MLRFIVQFLNKIFVHFGFEIKRRKEVSSQIIERKADDSNILSIVKLKSFDNFQNLNQNSLLDYFQNINDKDLHKWFHYFDFYERFFSKYRNTENLKILEISI